MSSARPDLRAEPEASLRADLLQQIEAAQAALGADLAQLRTGGDESGLVGQGEAQLGALSQLQRQLDQASPSALAMMRATVTASVAASFTLAQQARAAASSPAQTAGSTQLATASAEARSTVAGFMRDMYERKIFEPYLHFSSTEDEDAYRKREAETKRAIEEALKPNTPEGNLRANKLSIAQLKDAGAHGADRSPEYAGTLSTLENSEANLAHAVAHTASAQKAVGAKASTDPLDAVAAAPLHPDLLARIRATGMVIADQSQQGHGVTAQARAAAAPALGA